MKLFKSIWVNNVILTVLIIVPTTATVLFLAACGRGNKTETDGSLTGSKSEPIVSVTETEKQQPAKESPGQAAEKPSVPKETSPTVKPEAAEKPVISPEAKQNSAKLFEQGYVLYNNGEYEAAVKVLKQAIQADPENYQAYNVLGVSQAFLGLYGEADRNIDQAIKLNPKFANSTFNKAISMKLQKKYDEAIKYFDMTIGLNSNDVWSHYGKATIYSEREDVKNCIASLKTAIDRDPGVKEAVKEEREFDPVRNSPEFQKLMQ